MANKVTILAFLIVYLCVNSSQSATVVRGDRGSGDYFPNPDCDSTTCPNTCPQYHAHCSPTTDDTYPCYNCYCRGKTLTYVGNGKDGGRCVRDVYLIKDTIPKGNTPISNSEYKVLSVGFNTGLKESKGEPDSIKYLWIYTPRYHVINLKTLNCLTAGSNDEITVSPCKLNSSKQRWYLNSRRFLFNNETGKAMYISDTRGLYLTSERSDSFKLENKPPATVEYRGCYRLNDGSFIRYLQFDPNQCESAKDCHIDIKFLAPLYEENSKCTINWNTSSYLIDNKPWQYVRDPDSKMAIIPSEDFRGNVLRISYASYQNWSGKVLKLQVKCSSKTTSEEQCVLVKFRSGSKQNIPTTDPRSDSSDKKSSHSNPYKISTIVLSVLICIILVGILAYVMQNIIRKKLRHDGHTTSDELPVCAETDGEPEM